MIRIDAKISGEEALVRLDTLPKRFRGLLEKKLQSFLETKVKGGLLVGHPGRYLDPKYVGVDVTTIGSLLIGTLEGEDKPGVYSIFPTKARLLRFESKSGDIVFTKRVLLHPFPKAAPMIERYFRDNKPWLLEQVEDLVFEAVYDAR
jgi:hypothetical protein